jgi:pimeloyl-ACP methyl ester carboxylesterase
MAAAQKPISANVLGGEAKFGPPAWKSFPTWYIVSEKDQMLPPAAQHMFAQRMGAAMSSIAGSHVLMVSHPDEITAFIIRASHAEKPGHAAN